MRLPAEFVYRVIIQRMMTFLLKTKNHLWECCKIRIAASVKTNVQHNFAN